MGPLTWMKASLAEKAARDGQQVPEQENSKGAPGCQTHMAFPLLPVIDSQNP